jgi:nitric oxide reductase NorE protein
MTLAVTTANGPGGSGTETGHGAGRPRVAAADHGAMWVYIVGDLFIFGGWFVFYLVYRAGEHTVFAESQAHLSQTMGLINTIILLVSSWLVALCVNAARARSYDEAARYAWLTILCGAVFAATKLYEWTSNIAEGRSFTSNDFFMFYYFLTAIHLFHVLCGFIVLGVLVRTLRTPALRSQGVIENCAAYWHMVDLLWVVIFALVYLLR